MKRNQITIFFCFLFLLLFSSCNKENITEPGSSEPKATFVDKGREYTALFYGKKLDDLRNHFSETVRSQVSLAELESLYARVNIQLGSEKNLCYEAIDSVISTLTLYNRIATFDKISDSVYIQFAVDDTFAIYGFHIGLLRNAGPNTDYVTKAALSLPFEGVWTVLWGGRTIYQNYHTVSRNQFYAYDFLIIQNRLTFSGNGTLNEQYFSFDKPVLAPASGRIIAVENNVNDNLPGTMNPNQPFGNYVIIDHGENEFSVVAHFKKGSVVVSSGDSVLSGQVIGKCGNSGNSSEPHIHYQLQDSQFLNQGLGLPAQFEHYWANSQLIERGEPVQGEKISRLMP